MHAHARPCTPMHAYKLPINRLKQINRPNACPCRPMQAHAGPCKAHSRPMQAHAAGPRSSAARTLLLPSFERTEPCFYRASSGPDFFYRTPNGPSFNCMNFRVAFLHQHLCFLGVAKIRIKIWKYFELGGVENSQKFWYFGGKWPKISEF